MLKKGKRMVVVILAFVMVLSSVGSFANGVPMVKAQEKTGKAVRIWNGKADTSWYTGDKQSYDVSTAEQLAGLAQIAGMHGDENRFVGVTVNLTSDIVLNDTSNWKNWGTEPPRNVWTPIGRIGSPWLGYCPFAGCFNGNGHTISGMYVNGGEECGLFTYTSGAVIKDLKIEKSYIQANGGGVPYAGSIVGLAESTYFDRCSAEDVIVYGNGESAVASEGAVGGLVGVAKCENIVVPFIQTILLGFGVVVNPMIFGAVESGNASGTYFSYCTVTNATVKSTCTWYTSSVGGLIGAYRGMNGIISHCSTKNVDVSSVDTIKYNTVHTGPCGGIYGDKEGSMVVIDESFCTYFTRTDPGSGRSDAGDVPDMTPKPNKTQTVRVKHTRVSYRASKLKAKARMFNLGIFVKDKAKVTVSGLSKKKAVKIGKNGKVTVTKGTKKGTYTVKIKISVKATATYKATSVTKTVTVKVK